MPLRHKHKQLCGVFQKYDAPLGVPTNALVF